MKKLQIQPVILVMSAFAISGCAATTETIAPSAPSAPTITPPAAPAPAAQSNVGLESVLGLNASQLKRKFGNPRLDVREANGRKLQFNGKACIMDVYLYAPDGRPANEKSEVAAHIDARRTDGAEVDRASCVRALSR